MLDSEAGNNGQVMNSNFSRGCFTNSNDGSYECIPFSTAWFQVDGKGRKAEIYEQSQYYR